MKVVMMIDMLNGTGKQMVESSTNSDGNEDEESKQMKSFNR